MKGVRIFKLLGLAACFSIRLIAGMAWGATAVPVSPEAVTRQSCPTFSWSAADNATAYRIEVYELATADMASEEQMRMAARPVISKEITSPALSWTLSEGECLRRGGQYVWYVAGVAADAGGTWSGGKVFQVEASALSVEQKDAVKEVVRETIKGESSSAQAATTGSANITGSPKTATTAITPMALPPIISAYGNADSTVLGSTAGVNLNLAAPRYDTFLGAYAGSSNTTGVHNTFLGHAAGYSTIDTDDNTFVGYGAGYYTTGYDNTFIGSQAGFANNTGHGNAFVGNIAGYSNTTGNFNSFIGSNAGYSNTTGVHNSFIGTVAGYWNTMGSGNVFLGSNAGGLNTTGHDNVYIGYRAGYSETTGSNKLYIDNCYTLGSCTKPLIYGEFDNRLVRIDGRLELVTVATPSDLRYKKEVRALESSLEKVLKLQGVTYEWDMDRVNGAGYKDGKQIGLIAQEVEMVLPELVHTDSKGYKALSYDKLGPVLIEAVKELATVIKEKNVRIANVENKMAEKVARIERLEEELEMQRKSLAAQQEVITAMIARLAEIERPGRTLALK